MFNCKKFKFFSRLISFTLTSVSMGQQNSYALDLTIDLPLNTGKSPVLYYHPQPIEKEINSDSLPPPPIVLQNKKVPINQAPINQAPINQAPINQAPINQAPINQAPINQAVRYIENKDDLISIQDKNFPELACLKDNIDFWEKVYSDIDLNEGIVHDRNNLGRIYAVVNIPRGEAAKTIFLKREKKLIEAQLVSLAKKIRSQDNLNLQEKLLSKLFTKKELSYKSLIEAASNIRIQTGLKSQFSAGIQRSMNYMSVVFPIVEKSGLPIDLVYLPHVESSYNSRAGSKVGALGLWQLMPSTMRNLEGREAVYKRTDPSLSTKAAMKLLKMNYDKMRSWPLALTAYNHGANGISRAIQETNSRDLCKIIDHYDSPSFKFASSNFYAQFLAARKVAMRKYKTLANTQHNAILKQNLLTATGGAFR